MSKVKDLDQVDRKKLELANKITSMKNKIKTQGLGAFLQPRVDYWTNYLKQFSKNNSKRK
jgi:hypothetical protein